MPALGASSAYFPSSRRGCLQDPNVLGATLDGYSTALGPGAKFYTYIACVQDIFREREAL